MTKRAKINKKCQILRPGGTVKDVLLVEALEDKARGKLYHFRYGEAAHKEWLDKSQFKFITYDGHPVPDDNDEELKAMVKFLENLWIEENF